MQSHGEIKPVRLAVPCLAHLAECKFGLFHGFSNGVNHFSDKNIAFPEF